jgi:Flp pilus assembly protein TadD
MSTNPLITKYEGLLKARPNDELIMFSLGKALLDAGRMVEAETMLRLALEKKPDWMIVTMLLAKIADQNKDFTGARALWEKGLELAIAQNHEGPEEECRAELARLDRDRQAQQSSGDGFIGIV